VVKVGRGLVGLSPGCSGLGPGCSLVDPGCSLKGHGYLYISLDLRSLTILFSFTYSRAIIVSNTCTCVFVKFVSTAPPLHPVAHSMMLGLHIKLWALAAMSAHFNHWLKILVLLISVSKM